MFGAPTGGMGSKGRGDAVGVSGFVCATVGASVQLHVTTTLQLRYPTLQLHPSGTTLLTYQDTPPQRSVQRKNNEPRKTNIYTRTSPQERDHSDIDTSTTTGR